MRIPAAILTGALALLIGCTAGYADTIKAIQEFRRPEVKLFELRSGSIAYSNRVAKETLGAGPWPILEIHPSGFYRVELNGKSVWVSRGDVDDGRVVDVPRCRDAIKGSESSLVSAHTNGLGGACRSGN